MIGEPKGVLYAVKDENSSTYRGEGKFHNWPISITINRASLIAGKACVEIRIYDGDQAPYVSPSQLIDGFGYSDPEPALQRKVRRRR